MRIGPLLLIATVVVGGACTSDSRSTETPTVVTTVDSGTESADGPFDPARLCVSTDPGMTPISVHRALSCPDGTSVSVRGIIIGAAGGSVLLCDSAAGGDDCLTIDQGVLPIDDNRSPVDQIFYRGTMSNGVLTVDSPPAVDNAGSVVLSPVNRPLSPLRSG